jgi:hypothetical protein
MDEGTQSHLIAAIQGFTLLGDPAVLRFGLILRPATYLSYAGRKPPHLRAIRKSYLIAARRRWDE